MTSLQYSKITFYSVPGLVTCKSLCWKNHHIEQWKMLITWYDRPLYPWWCQIEIIKYIICFKGAIEMWNLPFYRRGKTILGQIKLTTSRQLINLWLKLSKLNTRCMNQFPFEQTFQTLLHFNVQGTQLNSPNVTCTRIFIRTSLHQFRTRLNPPLSAM